MAYFDASLMENPEGEYVLFMDIMGIQSRMLNSINQTSNIIFKMHATIIETIRKSSYTGISVYPIMDGIYLSAKRKEDFQSIVIKIFRELADAFIQETQVQHLYLFRGAIAYGGVLHGRNIPYTASLEFSNRVGYKEQIMIGQPMIYAFCSEKSAPPMGIFIHESALKNKRNQSNKFFDESWKWYENKVIITPTDMSSKIMRKIDSYYEWAQTHVDFSEYSQNSRDKHYKLAKEYFSKV